MFFNMIRNFALVLTIISTSAFAASKTDQAPIISAAAASQSSDAKDELIYLKKCLDACIENSKNPLNKFGSFSKQNAGKIAILGSLISGGFLMYFLEKNMNQGSYRATAEFFGFYYDRANIPARYVEILDDRRLVIGFIMHYIAITLIASIPVYGATKALGLLERKSKQLTPALQQFLTKWDIHRKFIPVEFQAGLEKLAIELKSTGKLASLDEQTVKALFITLFGEEYLN